MATSRHSLETGYFPCPARVNVADHVTLKLCPTNYFAWKQLMVTFLTNQKLICFVNGSISPMNQPTYQLRESWEDKCSTEEEEEIIQEREVMRREDWNELHESMQMPELLLNCRGEWEVEQDRVDEWEGNRRNEWKEEQERREAKWKREREQLPEWVQKLRETLKQELESKMEMESRISRSMVQKSREKGKKVIMDESQKAIQQEMDQGENPLDKEERWNWDNWQKSELETEQELREKWKQECEEKWKESTELKELWKNLDSETTERNKWYRERELREKHKWDCRREWELGEKLRLKIREEERIYTDWKRSDGLVMGWILAMVTEEILVQVMHLKAARAIWIKMEKIFTPPFNLPSAVELIDWSDQSTADNVSKYMELHRATQTADWEAAKTFLDGKPESHAVLMQPITWCLETALMVAVRSGSSDKRNNFVRNLIGIMMPEQLEKTDMSGATALHAAVKGGNVRAAKWLLQRNPQLANIGDKNGTLPVHLAATLGNGDMVDFLLKRTWKLSEDESDPKFLYSLASSGLYDIALRFLRENPRLASMKPSPLLVMAQNRTSFHSGTNLNFFQRLIYSVIPLKVEDTANRPRREIEVGEIPNRPRRGNIEVGESSNRPQGGEIEGDAANHHQEEDIEDPAKCRCCKWYKGCQWNTCCKCADHHQERDIENPANCMCNEFIVSALRKVWQKLSAVLFSVVAKIHAPQIKYIQDTKLTNHQAHELVKYLCTKIVETNIQNAAELFTDPLMNATCTGIHEIITEILDSFPGAIHIRSETDHSLFHLAIVYRQESIFNLIYQMEVANRCMFLSKTDASRNNGLHLAGKLTEEQLLSLRATVAGAAQQMQRELQWFKEVEKFVLHADRKLKNINGKTPQEVFTDTHKDLVKEGEKWMKDTATSCSIVVALITTIVFAAAITIPGSYNSNNGLPFFLGNRAFTLFSVSNALAMFSSSVSLLVFLSVLTCRYAEQDFLYSLPRRMIIGQVTLFLSIISMMVAFGATLKVVSGEMKARITVIVGVLCCVPITLFALLQFRLFLDMIKSTYFPGIFKKQSNCCHILT